MATLPGEGFESTVRSYRDGGQCCVEAFGRIVASWPADDPVARDVFIAAALRVGWQGTTIATLAGCAPSWVSRVRQRVAQGGFAALARRSPGGRPATLTASQRRRAEALRAQGLSLTAVAARLRVARSVVGRALRGIPAPEATPPRDLLLAYAPSVTDEGTEDVTKDATEAAPAKDYAIASDTPVQTVAPTSPCAPTAAPTETLAGASPRAGVPLPEDGTPHPCRYAGTLLVVAAVQALGLAHVLAQASVQRPARAVYPAPQVLLALCAAWTSGLPSLEAMHEQDPFALGVVLGLERSPSVRTLHRAVAQMVETTDPIQWWAGWMTALLRHHPPALPVFGVDGHFQPYAGEAPVDKGWNTKRRLAEPGLMSVRVNDLRGQTVSDVLVPAGDALSAQVLTVARALDAAQTTAGGAVRPVVLAFDRGGFAFDALNALATEAYWYVTWVPASVNLPVLEGIAPTEDGVGEQGWSHPSLTHPARLLVERAGHALLPAVTNLPSLVDAPTVLGLLRDARGMQENTIKAARAFAHIDRLNDRGGADDAPDDRRIPNPDRKALKTRIAALDGTIRKLLREKDHPRRPVRDIEWEGLMACFEQDGLRRQLKQAPTTVRRTEVDPEARRALLNVANRQLLHPLKNALENARRALVERLGAALAPSAHAWDQETCLRTLTALLRAPGTVAFAPDQVVVTLDLPLPPMPHRRLATALADLDAQGLRFTDGRRPVRFRLAPRPVRPAEPVHELP